MHHGSIMLMLRIYVFVDYKCCFQAKYLYSMTHKNTGINEGRFGCIFGEETHTSPMQLPCPPTYCDYHRATLP